MLMENFPYPTHKKTFQQLTTYPSRFMFYFQWYPVLLSYLCFCICCSRSPVSCFILLMVWYYILRPVKFLFGLTACPAPFMFHLSQLSHLCFVAFFVYSHCVSKLSLSVLLPWSRLVGVLVLRVFSVNLVCHLFSFCIFLSFSIALVASSVFVIFESAHHES